MESIERIHIENQAKPSPLVLNQIKDLLRGLGYRDQDLSQEFFAGEEIRNG